MSNSYSFQIKGMDCASCGQIIETGVNKLPNVQSCSLNFNSETLQVSGDLSAAEIIDRIERLGYEVETDTGPVAAARPPRFWRFMAKRPQTRLALLGLLLVLPGLIFDELLPGLGVESPLIAIASILAMAVAGYPVVQAAWRELRFSQTLTINSLMTIAAVGAVLIGTYTEAGLIMVLFAFGEALEGFTAVRARHAIRSLMELAPATATLLQPRIDCTTHLGLAGYTGGPCPVCEDSQQQVSVESLQIGDRILVKPGARIPMDGRILHGHSQINQAAITGESRLIDKDPGDTLFAGSINGAGVLEIEVTQQAADNTISRLLKMVSAAQEKRAQTQRLIDRFARIYTPAVFLLAIVVATVPPLFFGQPFWQPDAVTTGWLYRGLALLVVACPCALVISTPVSIVSAISHAARHGVLIKGGLHLEALSQVRAIAFDKTGTLTAGNPAVVQIHAFGCPPQAHEECAACDDLLQTAASLEQVSEHPLAAAVVAAASRPLPVAENVQALVGQGIRGEVNGRSVFLGSHRAFEAQIPHLADCAAISAAADAGQTPILASVDGRYAGYIALADKVRSSSRSVVSQLRQLGLEPLVMLTGDSTETAKQIGQQVGINKVRANCLPEDKVTAVSQLQATHGTVAMVGDGINDTPALATATVGIAVGNSEQAMETADIALLGGDLSQLPFAIQLSKAAMHTIRANIGLSLGIKLIFLLLVLLGEATMWMAVFADMGTALLVTLNGMRLVR